MQSGIVSSFRQIVKRGFAGSCRLCSVKLRRFLGTPCGVCSQYKRKYRAYVVSAASTSIPKCYYLTNIHSAPITACRVVLIYEKKLLYCIPINSNVISTYETFFTGTVSIYRASNLTGSIPPRRTHLHEKRLGHRMYGQRQVENAKKIRQIENIPRCFSKY